MKITDINHLKKRIISEGTKNGVNTELLHVCDQGNLAFYSGLLQSSIHLSRIGLAYVASKHSLAILDAVQKKRVSTNRRIDTQRLH